MITNPFYNAVLASGYIVGIVYFIFAFVAQPNTPDSEQSLLIPIAMLSLFVLSAAVMGYLFLYQPLVLYFENKRAEAAQFFLATVGAFAALTLVLFCILLLTR